MVAAAFFGFPLLALLPESWLARLPAGSGIIWLVAGPMVVMALAMLVNKMMQARRASVWPQAAGRITKSEVGANYHRPSDRPVELTNYPAIEYEYSVAGQPFTGRRISIGEDTGGANTEATLAHYPLGATVMVDYDPDDPGSCVLERDIPKQVPLGCVAILAILAALGYGGYWLFNHFQGVVEPYMEDGKGRTVIFTIVGGLVALMLFIGSRLGAKGGSNWPVVRGKVVLSRTESYRARASRTTVTSYVPALLRRQRSRRALRSREPWLGGARKAYRNRLVPLGDRSAMLRRRGLCGHILALNRQESHESSALGVHRDVAVARQGRC